MDIQQFIDKVADGVVALCCDKIIERIEKPIEDDIITARKAQDMLDIDASTLYKWEQKGMLKRVGSLGNKVYFSKSQIIKAIMQNK